MKKKSHLFKLTLQIILLVFLTGCSFGYEGCSIRPDTDPEKEYMSQQIEQAIKEQEQGRIAEDEDMALAEGEILKVRLHYGKDTLGYEAWYKVRIDNQQNGWYDYVEITASYGFGNAVKNYDDYDFTAVNFNKQYDSEYYDQSTIDGPYIMTITGSNGHYVEKALTWDSDFNEGKGGWRQTNGLLTYNVP